MGEAVVSVSQGAIGVLLGKLGVLLTDEYKLLTGANSEVISLKSELESMHAFLKKMSDVEEPDEQAKCWAREVHELSYDIEDKVDDFLLRVDHESNSSPPQGFKGFLDRCLTLLTAIWARYQIAKDFRSFKERAVEVSERHKRYKIDDVISKPSYMSVDLRLLAIYAETAGLVGIEGPRSELIQLMMEEESISELNLKVISIVGFGGLGKTTLANEVYRKLDGKFQCRAFVSMSQKPNMKKILRSILHQVGYVPPRHNNIETWDEDELIIIQQEFLRDKRYLIIIDDIWDASLWHIIRCALPECTNGSRVITTTRIEAVAKACCVNHYEHVYKMKPLSSQDSRMLFFKRIFGLENACPPYLEEVSAKILKKCSGLPLAIIMTSSLLASQPYKLKEQWQYILNSLGPNSELNPSLEGIRKILNLSYINLPHYLKTCMLYLGIYPEDYTIYKNDLTRQWVAEGFICKAQGRDPEDVGNSYFNELINRSMVQPVYTDHNGDVQSCRVHDMMLDLILHKSREANFITVTEGLQSLTGQHDKVRRLSLHLDGLVDGSLLEITQLSQARGLARFGTTNYIPPLLKFMHLRVLNIEFPSHSGPRTLVDLSMISHLFQLRYLKIVTVDNVKLPDKIRGLQNLETLEIETASQYVYPLSEIELPVDIIHLKRLLHLIFRWGVRLPDEIGNMKGLRTLKYFDLDRNSLGSIKDLGDLTSLRDLKISCFQDRCHVVDPLDTPAYRRKILFCSLEKLCNVKYMYVSTGFRGHRSCWDELNLSCLRHLQKLYIHGSWFSRVHKWFGELHNLYELDVTFQEVLEDDMGILAQLPSLMYLKLQIKGTPREKIAISGSGFPVLKDFTIICIKISYVTFEIGAMPKLQKLRLCFNAQGWDKYGAAPPGITHLSGLKQISAKIGCYCATGSNRTAAPSELKDALDEHPSRPTINIECEDSGCFDFDDFIHGLEQALPIEVAVAFLSQCAGRNPRGSSRSAGRNPRGSLSHRGSFVRRLTDDDQMYQRWRGIGHV